MAIDLDQAKYWKGEALLSIQRCKDQISDIKARLDDKSLSKEKRAIYTEWLITWNDLLAQSKEMLDIWNKRIPNLVTHDQAIEIFRKFSESGDMRPLLGYKEVFLTDSRFDIERIQRAALSTNAKLRWVTNKPEIKHWCVTILFTPDMIEEIWPLDDESEDQD